MLCKHLTLSVIQHLLKKSKSFFLCAKYNKDQCGKIKISKFYTKWNGTDYSIESVGDPNYNEMVKIYKNMTGVDEKTAKNAIWHRKSKEALQKQKN